MLTEKKKDWILKKKSLIDVCAHAWQAAIEEVCWKMSILSIQQLVCEVRVVIFS